MDRTVNATPVLVNVNVMLDGPVPTAKLPSVPLDVLMVALALLLTPVLASMDGLE